MHKLFLSILVAAGLGFPSTSVLSQSSSDTNAPAGDLEAAGPPIPRPSSAEQQNAKTIEGIQGAIANAEKAANLAPELRKRITDQYQAALKQLEAGKAHRDRLENYRKSIENAAADITRLRDQIRAAEAAEAGPSTLPQGITRDASLEQLRQTLARQKANLNTLKNEVTQTEQALVERQKRPAVMQQEKGEAEKRLAEAEAALKPDPPSNQPPEETEASRTLASSRISAALSEIAMLDAEMAGQHVLTELITAKRDAAVVQEARFQNQVQKLEALITAASAEEAKRAQQQAQQALREARMKHPLIQMLAATNTLYATRLTQVTSLSTNLAAQLDELEDDQRRLQTAFTNASRQFEAAGLSEALATYLQTERRTLPDPRQLEEDQSANKATIAAYGLARVQTEAALRQLLVLGAEAKRFMADTNLVDAALPDTERQELEREVRQLLAARKEILSKLDNSLTSLLDTLRRLDETRGHLIRLLEDYARFLDERLLWIPSSPPVSWETFRQIPEAVDWLFGLKRWPEITGAVQRTLAGAPFTSAAVGLVFFALVATRARSIRLLETTAAKVRLISTDDFKLTLRAVALTFFLAAPLALPLFFLGARLAYDPAGSAYTIAVGTGLLQTAPTVLIVMALRELCRSKGLGETHFRWEHRILQLLRTNLLWLAPIMIAAVFINMSLGASPDESHRHSLGRAAYAASSLAMAFFLRQILKPSTGVFASYLEAQPTGWMARLSSVWYPLALGSPLAMVVLAAAGYFYTALHLRLRLVDTFAFISAAILLHHLAIRWLFVRERKLALQKALERRQAALAARKEKGETESDEQRTLLQVEEPEVSLEAIKAQTRQLLRTLAGFGVAIGVWLIWAPEFPALNHLNNFGLWEVTREFEGAQQVLAITLANLLSALVTLILTIVAAKNLPGLLEIVILQNLPLAPSSRYGITAISQYFVVLIGILIASNAMGVQWSQLGWMAAALSVGIGFGLQEVVANFVSGILLLIERPIRVGDIITVADVSGVVSRIQIRATTIIDWDRKEFIIPNKDLITGRVLNWTLSNTVNRVVVEVGIAYGSDTEKARQILLQIAREQPIILNDPAPAASFEGFGDSSLKLVLRCFLPSFETRLDITNLLHTQIHQRFAAAGIEIAFPQQDIRIRAIDPSLRLPESATARKDV